MKSPIRSPFKRPEPVFRFFMAWLLIFAFTACPAPFPGGSELDIVILMKLLQADGTSTDTGTLTSTDTGTSTSTSSPSATASSLSFSDTYDRKDKLGGTVSIGRATDESTVESYVLYWGSSSTTKQSTTAIATITRTGSNLSYTITGGTALPSGATHLLVYTSNSNGENTTPVATTITDLVEYYIFVHSNTAMTGNLGGISGADGLCDADKGNHSIPDTGGTYKALLLDNSSRTSVTAVLKASTTYQRPDGTIIDTTGTDSKFTFNLDAAFSTTANVYIWTGMDASMAPTDVDCTNWTIGTSGPDGDNGSINSTTNASVYSTVDPFSKACDNIGYSHTILCVEQ